MTAPGPGRERARKPGGGLWNLPKVERARVACFIDRQVAGAAPEAATLRCLRTLSLDHQIYKLLLSILGDPAWLAWASSHSYAHSNGFDKLVLLASRKLGWKLRLHSWWGPPVEEHIHNHRWDFGTTLLFGRYRAVEYARDGTGTEHVHEYEYRSPGTRGQYALVPIGPARLAIRADASYAQGDAYFLHQDVLHRVFQASHGPAASLFLQGPPRADRTAVFSYAPVQETQPGVPRLSCEAFRARIENVLHHLIRMRS